MLTGGDGYFGAKMMFPAKTLVFPALCRGEVAGDIGIYDSAKWAGNSWTPCQRFGGKIRYWFLAPKRRHEVQSPPFLDLVFNGESISDVRLMAVSCMTHKKLMETPTCGSLDKNRGLKCPCQ